MNKSRPQQRFLDALEQLPPPRRGPVLRAERVTVDWSPPRQTRRPEPWVPRLLAGEFQRRLVLTLAGVAIFVVIVTALGASFFA
jgi:hypothetical protein